jgi:hypothetical protein
MNFNPSPAPLIIVSRVADDHLQHGVLRPNETEPRAWYPLPAQPQSSDVHRASFSRFLDLF